MKLSLLVTISSVVVTGVSLTSMIPAYGDAQWQVSYQMSSDMLSFHHGQNSYTLYDGSHPSCGAYAYFLAQPGETIESASFSGSYTVCLTLIQGTLANGDTAPFAVIENVSGSCFPPSAASANSRASLVAALPGINDPGDPGLSYSTPSGDSQAGENPYKHTRVLEADVPISKPAQLVYLPYKFSVGSGARAGDADPNDPVIQSEAYKHVSDAHGSSDAAVSPLGSA